jgi:hypothetical protein
MATRPGRGTVGAVFTPIPSGFSSLSQYKGRYRNGLWRPDLGFDQKFGIRIVMRRENGITKGDVLRVPMRLQAPSLNQLQREYQFNWATYDTVRVGQKSRPDGRQLMTLSVDTMLLTPDTQDSSSGAVIWPYKPDPQRVIDELLWISGYTPGSQPENFRLVLSQPEVWGSHAIVNMLASLTGVTATQQQGELGTEYVTLSFEEFPENELGRSQRPVSHGQTTWKLKTGDTLYEIAKKSHWHQPSAWKTIAKANGITGVSPSSAADLAAWAKRHHKTSIAIPAKGRN